MKLLLFLFGVTLTWQPGCKGPKPDGFRLYSGTESGVYTQSADVGPVVTYMDVRPGPYYYAVTAYNADGESAKSNEVYSGAE